MFVSDLCLVLHSLCVFSFFLKKFNLRGILYYFVVLVVRVLVLVLLPVTVSLQLKCPLISLTCDLINRYLLCVFFSLNWILDLL